VRNANMRPVETGADTPFHRCVPRLVEDQAAIRPNAPAIVKNGETLTYKKLNDRADALALQLRSAGVTRDVPVALCAKSSISMIVGALAILKAGGAYLPLDPDYPEQRLSFILSDAGSPVLLTTGVSRGSLPEGKWKTFDIDELERSQGQCVGTSEIFKSQYSDLAYVIYTSGSTGKPKGVEIEHRSLLNLVDWHQRTFKLSPDDRATQIAGVGFDAAVWEIWPYLTAGASIHIPNENIRTEPMALRDWLIEQKITISFMPTAIVERLMRLEWPAKTSLRTLLTGADTLHHFPPPSLPFEVVNNYGPTECSVVATSGMVPGCQTAQERPTIGKPITNTRIYLLDENMNAVPTGTPGEIYIAGAGLARGYRNRPDLTTERFVADPFTVARGSRMYKTGDRACMLPDGQIAFLGRIDDQIKVLGYRIEPNEIVSALNQHPAISESAVVAREMKAGEMRLIAYIVPSLKSAVTHSGLQEFLKTSLPEYMVPGTFVHLERLPLTANGKLDRAALADATNESTLKNDTFEEPRSAVEERVSALLTDLLEVDSIGIHDNFFHLGGHSLLGAQVISRVRETFDVELSLRAIFDHPTVEEISAEIERLILAKLDALGDNQTGNIVAA
jgi:amino acid adenylation domain-containing protein